MLTKKEFEQLFDTYIDDVISFLFTYASNKAQVKDWGQQVFIKIWEKRDKINFDHPAFKSYLLKTARNHALKKLKKERKYDIWLEKNLIRLTNVQLPKEITSPQSELEEAYECAISKIPPRAKKAYLLNREEGLIYSEVAEVMNISLKTVESHISKALAILRKELKQYSSSNLN